MDLVKNETIFESTFKYKIIYIFEIKDENHKGLLKIGDTTIETSENIDNLSPNCRILNQAAMNRIKQYTNTAAIDPILLHTELAVKKIKNEKDEIFLKSFRDNDVHKVLENSNIPREKINNSTSTEWFRVDLNTAINAINAVKNGYKNLSNSKIETYSPIIFRAEQEEAINKTIKQFKTGNKMLWNAKMRFGKTLCALEVIKRENKFKKSIIITHRPVVDAGWYEDFTKIFYEDENYIYGSKNKGYNVEELEKSGKNYVYFASMQDLRGSDTVGGKFEKNNEVFDLDWDLVIVDEAHEGTTTALGDDVIKNIVKENNDYDTKFLALSGTPFNILRDYEEGNIYTWDYIMEQTQKKNWDIEHFGDSNPYEELPELKIFTYDLGKIINDQKYVELEDKAFNFKEFFRTWTGNINEDGEKIPEGVSVGDFYHKDDIESFLNLITKNEKNSNYPYSTKEYRDLFKHSLWMVPGVKEAKALSQLMKKHPVFMGFEIVNVAGEGDDEARTEDALKMVKNAIKNAGNDGYTITISCGRLTTGVTVPEWTAVMMLSGSYSTSASNYLQTIFRVQSPCNKDGKIKTSSYVFDFAPDRTLKMIAESVAISTKAGKTHTDDKQILGAFLNYCPVIAIDGTNMKKYDSNRLLQQLKRAYAERAVQNGFDDANIYNDELLKLDDLALEEFQRLKGIIGTSKSSHKTNEIDINNQGFTAEEYEEKEKLEKKKERTPEEQERLDELKEKNKNKKNAISILRGISIRMPLLIYGADVPITEDITIEQIPNLVDDSSWEEFMPKGVTKEEFKKFMKYYDSEIFIAAGRKIRNIVKSADELEPLERVKKISMLFSCFKNPDKETVLTPWRVVNMHMGDCLGGYNFYDENYQEVIEEPRFIDLGKVTADTLHNTQAKILEINSKTGLYPLYVTYSIYATKCEEYKKDELTRELKEKLWENTVQDNVYVICKTPMAKQITQRTLAGLKDIKVNAHYFDDLINMMKNKPRQFIDRVLKPSYWKKEGTKMDFDAVVGNPPYQENISSNTDNNSLGKQLFPYFIINSIELESKYVSLITPSRWFTGDAQDKSFVKLRGFVKKNNHISKLYNYKDEKDLFSNVEIKGGVNYFLYQNNYDDNVEFVNCYKGKRESNYRKLFENNMDIIISDSNDYPILKKVKETENFKSLMSITKGRNAFEIIGKPSNVNKISSIVKFDGACELRCKGNEVRYIKSEIVKKNIDVFKAYKVFISKSSGNPNKDMKIIGYPYIGYPNSACTDSLIPIGNFNNITEAQNLQKYIKTKFLRFLVSIKKISQNVTQIVYEFVPLQDFTEDSDINWNKSVSDIDKQLYNKYNLTEEEINYIEKKIKPMD